MKTCYILRGCSGSGKSTVAKSLNLPIVSADLYFMQDGEYKFDKDQLGQAHSYCFNMFSLAIEAGVSVVVDNTNTKKSEWERYELPAKKAGYLVVFIDIPVEVITVHGAKFPSEKYIEACAARNVHGVPKSVIEAQCERLLLSRGF